MNYQVKRINPYWVSHPMIPTGVAIGAICGIVGYLKDQTMLMLVGAILAGLAIFLATKPVFSAVLATLGLFGGLLTFVFIPNAGAMGMGLGLRLLSTLLFAVFYMVLMDALVLVVAVLYNLFSGVVGLPGVELNLEEAASDEAPGA